MRLKLSSAPLKEYTLVCILEREISLIHPRSKSDQKDKFNFLVVYEIE